MIRRLSLCLVLATVTLTGCNWPATPFAAVLGLGEPCFPESFCREPLACTTGSCEPTGELAAGETCVLSGDCQPGLHCLAGICTTAGPGGDGALCASTTECQQNLYCAFEGFGGTCRPAGRTDIENGCTTYGDCAGGLICDPVTKTCQLTGSPPVAVTCERDLDCLPEAGVFCLPAADPADRVCNGLGPDGQPFFPWDGTANCEATNELSGAFRILFDIDGSLNGNGFYRLPFPNDTRLLAGHIDMSGHPTPPLTAVPADLLARYIAATEARELDGFGPNQTVFMRFSGPPKFCAQGCGTAGDCAEGCMGPGEPGRSLYVIDLTKDGTGAFINTPFNGINYRWVASSGRNHYICWNFVAIIPANSAPWKPGHTYFAYVHTRIEGTNDETLGQAPDFAAMLAGTDPGGSRARAWQAHAPLREWLATEPAYFPACRDLCVDISDCSGDDDCYNGICGANRCAGDCAVDEVCAGNTCEKTCVDDDDCSGGASCLNSFCVRDAFCNTCTGNRVCTGSMDKVDSSEMAGGAIFTVRDPTAAFADLATVAAAQPAPPLAALVACTDATVGEACSDGSSVTQPFVEVQGDVALPSFQEGTMPYEATGGAIALDETTGEPVKQADIWVRFSLTLPKSEPGAATPFVMPATGWPVVIYAHGTGGDQRSHITGGVAAALSRHSTTVPDPPGDATEVGFAVLGIEQVAHGGRAGDSQMQTEFLFFNFANADAARGNTLQGAADQITLSHNIGAFSTALIDLDGLLAALGLDPVTDSVALDPARVAYLGHSQGASLGALAMAADTTVPAVVFSGIGANFIETLATKTSPYDLEVITEMAIGDTYEDGHAHPAINLLQGYLEEVDATNFARAMSVEPPAAGLPKHYLQVIGVDDTFTPNGTSMIYARRADVDFIDEGASGLPNTSEIDPPPLRRNRTDHTRAATIHAPAAGDDGHFVLFDLQAVQDRVAEYFASWITDPEGIPTVQ